MLLVKLTVDTRTVLYRFHFRLLLVALNHLALEGHGVHEPWIVGWTLARQQLVARDWPDVLLVGVLHERLALLAREVRDVPRAVEAVLTHLGVVLATPAATMVEALG